MEEKGKQSSVLIVENDPSTVSILKILLKDKGFNVGIASTSGEALDSLQTTSYDVVITDLKLPEIDGYKLLDVIKTRHRKHKVMIISSNLDRREKFLHRGALEAFEKPFSLDKFSEELDRLLRERRRAKRFASDDKESDQPLSCVLEDLKGHRKLEGLLCNISIDGALVGFDKDPGDLDDVILEISLTKKSRLVFKLSGRVVRKIPGEGESCQEAVYFDDDRDLRLLEKIAPFITLKGQKD